MNNKIKSLIYLSCFILSSIIYNVMIDATQNQNLVLNTEQPDADATLSVKSVKENQINL